MSTFNGSYDPKVSSNDRCRKRKRDTSGETERTLTLTACLDVSDLGALVAVLPRNQSAGVVIVSSKSWVELVRDVTTENWSTCRSWERDGHDVIVSAALLPSDGVVLCTRGARFALVLCGGSKNQRLEVSGTRLGIHPKSMICPTQSTVAISWTDGSFCVCSFGKRTRASRCLWWRSEAGAIGVLRTLPALGRVENDVFLAFTYSTVAANGARCAIFSMSKVESKLTSETSEALDGLEQVLNLSSSRGVSTSLPVPLAVALDLEAPGNEHEMQMVQERGQDQKREQKGEQSQLVRDLKHSREKEQAQERERERAGGEQRLKKTDATKGAENREVGEVSSQCRADAAASKGTTEALRGKRRSSRRRQRTQKACVTCSSMSSMRWHEVPSSGQSMSLLFCEECFFAGRHLLLEQPGSEGSSKSRGRGKGSRRRSSGRKPKMAKRLAGPGSEIVGKTVEITHPRRKKERRIERVLVAEYADGRHRVFSDLDGKERWENFVRQKWKLADGETDGEGNSEQANAGAGAAAKSAAMAGAGLGESAGGSVIGCLQEHGRFHVVKEVIFAQPRQPNTESPLPCELRSTAELSSTAAADTSFASLVAPSGTTLIAATQEAIATDALSIFLWDARAPYRSICVSLSGRGCIGGERPPIVALDNSGRVFVLVRGAKKLCVLE